MTTLSNISSIRSAPGSGKNNVSFFDISDEEDEDVNMYESATSASEQGESFAIKVRDTLQNDLL